MTSIESSKISSGPDGRRPGRIYRGPEYLEAVGPAAAPAPLDQLVHPDPAHPPRLYGVVFAILRWLIPRLFRFEVDGRENIPAPPYVIASNHQGWYDTAFIAVAFPRSVMIYTMAKRETVFNRGWKRWLMPRLGVFPVSPRAGELDHEAINTVYRLLSRGAVVLIFPEGRYSRGRDLRPLKTGVAHFAVQAGVPICPVAVSGLERLRPLSRVKVSIGPPIWPEPPRRRGGEGPITRIVESVREAIATAFGPHTNARRRAWWRRLVRRPRLRESTQPSR